MIGLPQGYSSRPPTQDDAVAVAGLMAACVRVDGGDVGTSIEHVLDDWHEVDLAEEAVLALAPDGSVSGYANRAFVSLSAHGYVHPGHRGRGTGVGAPGPGSSAGARTGCG